MWFDILLILVLFDTVISYLSFKFYRYVEINPLMHKLINLTNLEIAMGIKLVSAFLLVWALRKLTQHPDAKTLNENFTGALALTLYITYYVAGMFLL
jgi:hypothetical protein